MSLKSETRDPSSKSLPEDLCSGFLCPEKNPLTSVGLEPASLGSRGDHVTHIKRLSNTFLQYKALCFYKMVWISIEKEAKL